MIIPITASRASQGLPSQQGGDHHWWKKLNITLL